MARSRAYLGTSAVPALFAGSVAELRGSNLVARLADASGRHVELSLELTIDPTSDPMTSRVTGRADARTIGETVEMTTTIGADPRLAPHAVPRLLPETALRTLPAYIERYGMVPRPRRHPRRFGRTQRPDGSRGRRLPRRREDARGCESTTRIGRRRKRNGGGAREHQGQDALDAAIRTWCSTARCSRRWPSGRGEVVICVDRSAVVAGETVLSAIAERGRRGVDPVPIRFERAPSRYVSGEESALVVVAQRW